MRIALAALVLFVAAVGAATAKEAQGGFSGALQGLWAESPITCDLLRRSPANAPSDRSWVRITPDTVSGTMSGRFIRSLGLHAAQSTDDKLSTVTIDFKLRRGDVLFETVTGARA